VEAGATDNAFALIDEGAPDVTEDVVATGLEESKIHIGASCDAQLALRELVQPVPREFPVFNDYTPEIYERVQGTLGDRLGEVIRIEGKADRALAEETLRRDIIDVVAGIDADEHTVQQVKAAFRALMKKAIRRRIVDEGVRIDGRGARDIRPLSARVGLVKRTHGSALFQRGETQVLSITTLGMLRMAQMLDIYDPLGVEEDRSFMHDYVFPPFS